MDEFCGDELAQVLAESRHEAGDLLDLAHNLAVKLPGTRAALRSGVLRQDKG